MRHDSRGLLQPCNVCHKIQTVSARGAQSFVQAWIFSRCDDSRAGKGILRLLGRYTICNVRNATKDQRHLTTLHESLMQKNPSVCRERNKAKLRDNNNTTWNHLSSNSSTGSVHLVNEQIERKRRIPTMFRAPK